MGVVLTHLFPQATLIQCNLPLSGKSGLQDWMVDAYGRGRETWDALGSL